MAVTRRLPDKLPADVTALLSSFVDYTMAHPILKAVDDKLVSAIRNPGGASLVFVYGPTGVGKTTLSTKIQARLVQEAMAAMLDDPGRIPVLGVEADATDSSGFRWKQFYRNALEALHEPFIDQKVSYQTTAYVGSTGKTTPLRNGGTAADLRKALENGLAYRKTGVMFVDEAQHLAKVFGGRRLQDQLDCIKSLASMTGTIHVLVGTYELLPFRNLSGQLSRRSIDVHFPRYRVEDEQDQLAFINILHTLQHRLPLREEPDLAGMWEYVYERTLGCVGILKDWLTKSLAVALSEGGNQLTRKHLQQHELSVSQCKRIAVEILDGESQLADGEDAVKLRALIGMGGKSEKSPDTYQVYQPTRRPAKQSRVGLRNATRDRVGTGECVG